MMTKNKTPIATKDIHDLIDIMRALRTPNTGCPWDLEQSFKTIAPYTIEEAYEVADAIERNDMEDLRLELGDLLFQSVYHAQMANEAGHFDFGDVVQGISAKMIRRHPHVFGTQDVTAKEFSAKGMASGTWEKIKQEEKEEAALKRAELGLPPKQAGQSLLDEVPSNMPSLAVAVKLQQKASKVGFDWNDPIAVLSKIREELDEVEAELNEANLEKAKSEIGDVLFAMANLARHLNIDPDSALRSTNKKFRNRFAYIEQNIQNHDTNLQDASLETMDALWVEAKDKF